MLSDEKILITGPSGMVGRALAHGLVGDNEVWGVARFGHAPNRAALDEMGVETRAIDLATGDLGGLPDDFTYVVHLAFARGGADDFEPVLANTAEGTGRILSHCRSAQAALVMSSHAIYALNDDPWYAQREADALGGALSPWSPTSPAAKITMEAVARGAASSLGLPVVIARLNTVYGPFGRLPKRNRERILNSDTVQTTTNPNTRSPNPQDANWPAPFLFVRRAWDGYLFDAPISGPGHDLIDATYDYGFGRLKGILPPNTYGGYGTTDYSTGYNAGYGEWGLASNQHRDQGILGYQFMIANTQSGPYSWWESVQAPDPTSPWIGSHPTAGAGASPHGWGAADANLVLRDSLIAERGDGSLIIGRGVPNAWVSDNNPIAVANLPINGGNRMGLNITTNGTRVTLTLSGSSPAGPVLFQLPAFVNNIASATAGATDEATGTVTLPATARTVTVTMTHPAT